MFRKTPESCGICSSNMVCFGVFFLELSILRGFSFQTLPRSSKLRYFNFLPHPPFPPLQKIGVVSLVSFPNFPPKNAHQERVNTLTAASRFIAGGKSGCWGIRGCYLDLPSKCVKFLVPQFERPPQKVRLYVLGQKILHL